MKSLSIIAFLLGTAALVEASDLDSKRASQANSTNRLEITGMTCDGCAKGVASELRRVPGVVSASVTFSNQLAIVALDTNKVSTKTLLTTIEEAGYKATPRQ